MDIDVDYGALPWQIVPELVAFRNKVAHSKNERLFEEVVVPQDKYDDYLNRALKTNWQKTATSKNAEKFMEHTENLWNIQKIYVPISGKQQEIMLQLSLH